MREEDQRYTQKKKVKLRASTSSTSSSVSSYLLPREEAKARYTTGLLVRLLKNVRVEYTPGYREPCLFWAAQSNRLRFSGKHVRAADVAYDMCVGSLCFGEELAVQQCPRLHTGEPCIQPTHLLKLPKHEAWPLLRANYGKSVHFSLPSLPLPPLSSELPDVYEEEDLSPLPDDDDTDDFSYPATPISLSSSFDGEEEATTLATELDDTCSNLSVPGSMVEQSTAPVAVIGKRKRDDFEPAVHRDTSLSTIPLCSV